MLAVSGDQVEKRSVSSVHHCTFSKSLVRKVKNVESTSRAECQKILSMSTAALVKSLVTDVQKVVLPVQFKAVRLGDPLSLEVWKARLDSLAEKTEFKSQ